MPSDVAGDGASTTLLTIEPPLVGSGAWAQSRIKDLRPYTTLHEDSDRIQGRNSISYDFGSGFEADTLKFSALLGRPVGAQSARNSASEEADGVFVGQGRAFFSVDGSYADGRAPAGTIIGTMSLAALTGLDAFTTFSGSVEVSDGSVPGGTELLAFSSAAGFSGAVIALKARASYIFDFRYEVRVPYGTVPGSGLAPPNEFDYSATISAVPVPGAMGLIGLSGLCARRRRS
jgi:MYXO-CTERM domain-containing protein